MAGSGNPLTPDLVRRAVVDRNPEAVRRVVAALRPIVHKRVARALVRRRAAARGRDLRQEVEDLVQDVFEGLLAHGGRRLLAWAPGRGSAEVFFGLVAERIAANILDSRRRSPWTDDPRAPETLPGHSVPLEPVLESRWALRTLAHRLRQQLGPRDWRMFVLMYGEGLDDAAVRDQLGLGRMAFYQARRRLRRRIRELASDLVADLPPGLGDVRPTRWTEGVQRRAAAPVEPLVARAAKEAR